MLLARRDDTAADADGATCHARCRNMLMMMRRRQRAAASLRCHAIMLPVVARRCQDMLPAPDAAGYATAADTQ